MEKAFNLADKCYGNRKKNTLISPLSLDFALAMIANGADGKTKEELEDFLEDEIESFNDYLKEYLEELSDGVIISNSIWSRPNIKEEFKQVLEGFYNSKVNDGVILDADIINNWVNDNTNGMISSIIDRISPNDLMILLNAIYFKEGWFEPFKEELIKVHPFTNLNGTIKDVEMMYSKENMYFENEEALAFSKPYKERFSFIGILPKKEGDFNLTDLNIKDLMRKRSYDTTFIGMPKFEMEDNLKIVEILKSLGLSTCFTASADFSKLFENETSNISNVIQKTAIKVDEEGTEAAAVTCVGMKKGCIRFEEPKEIILNRSFAFMIYDEEWNIPLFIGKITNL